MEETHTKGLDTLAATCQEYHRCDAGHLRETATAQSVLKPMADSTCRQGARFAKWRAALRVSGDTPSPAAVSINASELAKYACICQVSFCLQHAPVYRAIGLIFVSIGVQQLTSNTQGLPPLEEHVKQRTCIHRFRFFCSTQVLTMMIVNEQTSCCRCRPIMGNKALMSIFFCTCFEA